MALPQAQVLEFNDRVGYSIWIDYISRARTINGLINELQAQVKRGVYLGYRLHHVYVECRGVVNQPKIEELRMPYIPER